MNSAAPLDHEHCPADETDPKIARFAHRAKQGIVATGAFLFLLKPTAVPSAWPWWIEPSHQSPASPAAVVRVAALDHQATGQLPDMFDPIGIDLSQRAADGATSGSRRKPISRQHDWVVAIIIHLPQSAKPQKQVHHKQQHHQMPAKIGESVKCAKQPSAVASNRMR